MVRLSQIHSVFLQALDSFGTQAFFEAYKDIRSELNGEQLGELANITHVIKCIDNFNHFIYNIGS